MKSLKFTTSTTTTFTAPRDLWVDLTDDLYMDTVSHDRNSYLEVCYDDLCDRLDNPQPGERLKPAVKAFLEQVLYSLRVKDSEPDAIGFCKE